MAKVNQRNDADSLKRSHSTWSNTKLTSLCVVTIILFSLVWLVLGFKDFIETYTSSLVFYIALGSSALLTILCLLGFNKFKR